MTQYYQCHVIKQKGKKLYNNKLMTRTLNETIDKCIDEYKIKLHRDQEHLLFIMTFEKIIQTLMVNKKNIPVGVE